jgi:hypothetical protein
MKFNISSIILLSFLYTSCGQASQEDTFREKIDKIKKDDIPNMDFAASTYAVDSSAHWNVISQITQKQKSGNKTTIVNTEFKQNDKLVEAVSNDLNQKHQFQGQIITTDLTDKISLVYLLTDEQNKSSIFKISCNNDGKSIIEKIDSASSKEWTKIKLTILNKN